MIGLQNIYELRPKRRHTKLYIDTFKRYSVYAVSKPVIARHLLLAHTEKYILLPAHYLRAANSVMRKRHCICFSLLWHMDVKLMQVFMGSSHIRSSKEANLA